MDNKTVFIRTSKGESDVHSLFGDLKRTLLLIDGKSTVDEISRKAPPSLREAMAGVLQELESGGYIRDKNKPEVQIAAPKIATPKAVAPAQGGTQGEELDFTSIFKAPSPAEFAAEAAKQRALAEAKAKQEAEAAAKKNELEAAMAAAKAKADAEAAAKAEAKAKLEAEQAAKARAEAELKAKQEAMIRQQAEQKAKQEAEARLRAEQEAAKAKAAFEAAARAKIEAEMKAKAEAEARAKAEAAARAKAEAEAKARAEAEAKAKAEAEARARAEAEAKARAEAEAKARAEAEAKARAEAEARAKAEAEAARLKAELEAAAKAKAEAEAKAKAEEEARRKAEQEAAARAKAEAEAKAKAEAEARARVEAEAKAKAEHEAKLRADEATARAEQERAAQAKADADAAAQSAAGGFEIKLDAFMLGSAEPQVQHKAVEGTAPMEAQASAGIDLSKFEVPAVPVEETPSPAPVVPQASETPSKAVEPAPAEYSAFEKAKAAAEERRRQAEEEEARRIAEAEARKLADEQAKAWAEAEERAKEQARLEAERLVQQAEAAPKAAPKPIKRRKPLPWGKMFAGLVVLALAGIAVVPYIYPLQEYIPAVEQKLSAQFKQPVKVGGMRAALLPLPKLELQQVAIGEKQEIKVGNTVLNFDVLTIFSPVKLIKSAELQDVVVNGAGLEREALWAQQVGSNQAYPVMHLAISKLKVVSDEVSLPILSGEAQIDPQGKYINIALKSDDGKFSVELLPAPTGRWQLTLNVRDNYLPALPDMVFNDFTAKGELFDGGINISDFDARLFTGILQGNGQLSWNKGWLLQGHAEAKTMELNLMFPKHNISGELYGQGNFSFYGAKLSQLGESPKLDGSFIAKKGVITGMDMVETGRLMSRQHMVGGRTHYDEITGTFQLENHNQHLRQLNVASGILNASGSVDLTKGKQLAGTFSADLKMHNGTVPMILSGAINELNLRVK